MLEYSGFILVNRNTLGTYICRMSQDVGDIRYRIAQVPLYFKKGKNYFI